MRSIVYLTSYDSESIPIFYTLNFPLFAFVIRAKAILLGGRRIPAGTIFGMGATIPRILGAS